jgi:hypothetical protein
VQLNGKVNYSVPGPQPPGAVTIRPPLKFAGIVNLVADELEPSIQDIEINLIDEFDNALPEHLKSLDGIRYRIMTDLDDIREGKVKDGKINEQQVKIKDDFTIEFDQHFVFDQTDMESEV